MPFKRDIYKNNEPVVSLENLIFACKILEIIDANATTVDANFAEKYKQAYLTMAMKFHPDRNPGDAGAESKFKEINESHTFILNNLKELKEIAQNAQEKTHPSSPSPKNTNDTIADYLNNKIIEFQHWPSSTQGAIFEKYARLVLSGLQRHGLANQAISAPIIKLINAKVHDLSTLSKPPEGTSESLTADLADNIKKLTNPAASQASNQAQSKPHYQQILNILELLSRMSRNNEWNPGRWISVTNDIEIGITKFNSKPSIANSNYQISQDEQGNIIVLDKNASFVKVETTTARGILSKFEWALVSVDLDQIYNITTSFKAG